MENFAFVPALPTITGRRVPWGIQVAKKTIYGGDDWARLFRLDGAEGFSRRRRAFLTRIEAANTEHLKALKKKENAEERKKNAEKRTRERSAERNTNMVRTRSLAKLREAEHRHLYMRATRARLTKTI